MAEVDVAVLREKLTRAYLSGDGAAVVRLMDQIAEAERAAKATPEAPASAA